MGAVNELCAAGLCLWASMMAGIAARFKRFPISAFSWQKGSGQGRLPGVRPAGQPASNLLISVVDSLQNEVGKGAFQECDQLATVAGHVKWAGQAAKAADIPGVIAQAFQVGACAFKQGGFRDMDQLLAAFRRTRANQRLPPTATNRLPPLCPPALFSCRLLPWAAPAPPMWISPATS